VINLVGLTPALMRRIPALRQLALRGRAATIGHALPAVTCPVQATYLTGLPPREHGIVGNGWYFRDTAEIRFWQQSDRLVQRPRIWDIARQRDPNFTCANLFWWHAMYSSADVTVTPRPMYPADGRKLPDLWTHPPDLRHHLQRDLGAFPLFNFWGPAASIASSKWISAAAAIVAHRFNPTLLLVYLPHLDYCLQRLGPDDPAIERDLAEIDSLLAQLLARFEDRRIIILSEYGIETVNRPVHLNRVLREQGLVRVREELGRELLDAGASAAFAVADHQVAHVYVNDPTQVERVAALLQATPGVEQVLNRAAQRQAGIDHERGGELLAIAEPGSWYTYYYWLDDRAAPDFARTVDIHRKPGYDPVELFLDPRLSLPRLRIGWKLLTRHLGFRALLDVVPLDATLVRGSHGRAPSGPDNAPAFISSEPSLLTTELIPAVNVRDLLLAHVFD
jgi:predicted AlkP superfamily pyrophosphatase or phosphodiesterase